MLRFTEVEVRSSLGQKNIVSFGGNVEVVVNYVGVDDLHDVHMTIGIYDHFNNGIAWLSNELVGDDFGVVSSKGQFKCKIDKMPLMPGTYYLNLHCKVKGHLADWVKICNKFSVIEGDYYGTGRLPHWGIMTIPHRWEIDSCG